MNDTEVPPKREHLELRLNPTQNELIQRGTDLSGRSLTDFVVSSAQGEAEQAIRECEVITLSARDGLAFAQALLNPPAPNECLRAAAERYRSFVGE